MKIIYTTLNNNEEARKIGRKLLEKKMANCGQLSVEKINDDFSKWLSDIVK